MEIIRKLEGLGVIRLLNYINILEKNENKCSALDTFSSGEDSSMSEMLTHSVKMDKEYLTKTFLIINLNEKGEVDLNDHQIIAYYSLSSYYVVNINDTSYDLENYDPNTSKIKTKYPSIQIDSFAKNHNIKSFINDNFDLESNLGFIIFSSFIIPHLIDLSNYLGFKLVTLFSADRGTGKLIETYESYGFKKVELELDDDYNIIDYEHTTGNESYTLMAMDFGEILKKYKET